VTSARSKEREQRGAIDSEWVEARLKKAVMGLESLLFGRSGLLRPNAASAETTLGQSAAFLVGRYVDLIRLVRREVAATSAEADALGESWEDEITLGECLGLERGTEQSKEPDKSGADEADLRRALELAEAKLGPDQGGRGEDQ